MNKEILNQVQNLNIAEVKDTGTLQELASIADELINSSNAQERFLAHKIKNRLEQNDHYQNFLKSELIQKEEVKATADKQFEKAYQAHRETASVANLQTKKQEESKESKATQEAFNKLTAQQQQMIVKLEYLYLPELREQVREFMLDDSKATAENLANIMNKQLKGNYVQVETGKDGNKFTTMADNTPTDKTNEIEHIAQEGLNTSVELGKLPQAVEYGKVVNAANVKEADNNFEEGKEEAYRVFQAKTAENKTIIDIQGIAFQLNEDVFKKYAENLQKLEGVPKDEKEELLAEYENDLADNIENFLTKHNVDLSNNEQKELFVKSVLKNYTTLSEQQLKNILVKNCGIEVDFIENLIKEEQKLEEEAAIVDFIDTPEKPKSSIPDINQITNNGDLQSTIKDHPNVGATGGDCSENYQNNDNVEKNKVAIIDINNNK
nr:hypothetical protein [Actinobacillus pleuropneumoniae]